MVKDTPQNQPSIKKRRKNTSATENDGEIDVYKKVLDFEEKEALKRSTSEDANIYFETCNEVRTLLNEIFKLKQEGTPEARAQITEKCTNACVQIAVLKKLNRLDKFRTIAARESLIQEKQKVDSINLQFQNLLYESAHLLSEYKKCQQFKSKDEDIELISVEKFFEEAPEAITKPFKNKEQNDAYKHELHLARLEYELTQRKKLSELCHTLEDEKKKLASEIIERKKRLEGLGPRLNAVLEATKPLQEHLGLPIDKVLAEHKLASLLPDPLYLFYVNVDAYKQVYTAYDMIVEVEGDPDEAIQWNETQEIIPAEDSDQDMEQQEEPVEVKKRRHRKSLHIDPLEEKKKKLLEGHPLSILLTLTLKTGMKLKVKFFYRPQLKIITVNSEVEIPNTISANCAREVLSGENVLNELFERDYGTVSPNLSNHFQFAKVRLGSYQSLLPKLGYAYSWAQKICGLDFLDLQKNKESSTQLSQTTIELVIKALFRRMKARFALSEQIQSIEQNHTPILPEDIDYPRLTVSNITKWTSITWQNFSQNNSTQTIIEADLVSEMDMFYLCTVTRTKATLEALVVIRNDYPLKSPIFFLTLKYNGVHHSNNSDEIRDMERSLNVGWDQLSKSANWLLSVQIRHLCAYFDVYLETLDSNVFPQNSVFFRNVSGRNRRKPFKFRKIGTGVFV